MPVQARRGRQGKGTELREEEGSLTRLLFVLLFYMYVILFVYIILYVYSLPVYHGGGWCTETPEESVGSPRTGVTDGCEPPQDPVN